MSSVATGARRQVLAGLGGLVLAAGASRERARVVEVIAADRLKLADGREIRMPGIVPLPAGHASELVQELDRTALDLARGALEGREIVWSADGQDRHGAMLAGAVEAGDAAFPDALVLRGLAFASGRAAWSASQRLGRLEAAARAANRGLWALPDLRERGSGEIAALPLRFVLARGRVVEVAARATYLYVNFGSDWRSDLTGRMSVSEKRRFKRAGLDLDVLPGREVRLRGWVQSLNGAMIDVVEPTQIEMLS